MERYMMEERFRRAYLTKITEIKARVSKTHEIYLKYKTGQVSYDEAMKHFNIN